MSIQDSKPHEKQISPMFSYFTINNALLYHFLANWLADNKKMTEKSVFREAWSPELTSQSFPDPCFWARGFVPHRKWNLMLLVHQNTGKENRYGKNFFAILISTLGRFDRANKKICHIHFNIPQTNADICNGKLTPFFTPKKFQGWKFDHSLAGHLSFDCRSYYGHSHRMQGFCCNRTYSVWMHEAVYRPLLKNFVYEPSVFVSVVLIAGLQSSS